MPRTKPSTSSSFRGGLLLAAVVTSAAAAQTMPPHPAPAMPSQTTPSAKPAGAMATPAVLPTGMGDAIDRDLTRLRAATAPFTSSEAAVSAGYPAETNCVQHPAHGAMGYHYNNQALRDATLDVEKPEVLVYEKRADGTFKLNGVEFIVPLAAWTKTEPPTIMGQSLKRADSLGFWYLHVWSETVNPSGLFADWNPNVKC
ncbi:MAG: hypothetical protein ABIT71_11265 [Vicinamibacteraceae bacterium]